MANERNKTSAGAGTLPDCMVADQLKKARDMARGSATDIHRATGCNCIAYVFEHEGGGMRSGMASDPGFEQDEKTECRAHRATLARAMSLLILSQGKAATLCDVIRALDVADKLSKEAKEASK